MTTLASSLLYLFFFIVAGNEDNHKIMNGFDVQPGQTRDGRVSCP